MDIKKHILKQLILNQKLRYNQLLDKPTTKLDSNKFNYYLQKLIKEDLIEKQGEYYIISEQGKTLVAFMDAETAESTLKPLVTTIICVYKDDQILLQQRKREPFYNIWGLIGGKIAFEEFPSETAPRQLLEETNLTANLTYKGILFTKTYNKELLHNHQHHLFKATKPKGELKDPKEGKNKWVDLKEVKNYEAFPQVSLIIEELQKPGLITIEIERFLEKDTFTGMNILSSRRYS